MRIGVSYDSYKVSYDFKPILCNFQNMSTTLLYEHDAARVKVSAVGFSDIHSFIVYPRYL